MLINNKKEVFLILFFIFLITPIVLKAQEPDYVPYLPSQIQEKINEKDFTIINENYELFLETSEPHSISGKTNFEIYNPDGSFFAEMYSRDEIGDMAQDNIFINYLYKEITGSRNGGIYLLIDNFVVESEDSYKGSIDLLDEYLDSWVQIYSPSEVNHIQEDENYALLTQKPLHDLMFVDYYDADQVSSNPVRYEFKGKINASDIVDYIKDDTIKDSLLSNQGIESLARILNEMSSQQIDLVTTTEVDNDVYKIKNEISLNGSVNGSDFNFEIIQNIESEDNSSGSSFVRPAQYTAFNSFEESEFKAYLERVYDATIEYKNDGGDMSKFNGAPRNYGMGTNLFTLFEDGGYIDIRSLNETPNFVSSYTDGGAFYVSNYSRLLEYYSCGIPNSNPEFIVYFDSLRSDLNFEKTVLNSNGNWASPTGRNYGYCVVNELIIPEIQLEPERLIQFSEIEEEILVEEVEEESQDKNQVDTGSSEVSRQPTTPEATETQQTSSTVPETVKEEAEKVEQNNNVNEKTISPDSASQESTPTVQEIVPIRSNQDAQEFSEIRERIRNFFNLFGRRFR